MFVALDKLSFEGSALVAPPPSVEQTPSSASTPHGHNPAPILSIGSMVQVSDPPQYGVLRWIGEMPGVKGAIAGVEMVSLLMLIFKLCTCAAHMMCTWLTIVLVLCRRRP